MLSFYVKGYLLLPLTNVPEYSVYLHPRFMVIFQYKLIRDIHKFIVFSLLPYILTTIIGREM